MGNFMVKKHKKRNIQYRRVSIKVAQVFPVDDPLALDLLRIMAALNDLGFIAEWHDGTRSPTTSKERTIIQGSRFFLQVRLISSFLHEAFKVIGEITQLPEFNILHQQMEEEGRKALTRIKDVNDGNNPALKKLLSVTRSRTTFHYDRNLMNKSLKKLLGRYGHDAESTIVLRQKGSPSNPISTRPNFTIAEEVRLEGSFGMTNPDLGKKIQPIFDLVDDLNTFLNHAFTAFCDQRGLSGAFR